MQGVEAQTETVWQQSIRFKVPRLGFINKLDRQGAEIDLTLQSVREKLNCVPLLMNIPSGNENNFNGIIDLPTMMHYKYVDDLGKIVEFEQINHDHEYYDQAMEAREQLIDDLSNFDESIADKYLLGEEITSTEIRDAVRYVIK